MRGAEAARKLESYGAKRSLIRAAELGYITEVSCGMPTCFCPEELGGRSHFELADKSLSDWMPTFEHHPIPKRDGGRETAENVVLAHRICNRLDYSIFIGRSHKKDLERIRKAQEAAAASRVGGAGGGV